MVGFVVMGITSYCQTNIEFTYDNSGNRIERTINLNKSAVIGNGSEDGWNDTLNDQLSGYEIKIYPNPTKGRVKIDIPEISKNIAGILEIYDSNGRVIHQQKNIKPSNLVDISHAENGFYFLKLRYQNETLEWKIIKQ